MDYESCFVLCVRGLVTMREIFEVQEITAPAAKIRQLNFAELR